MDAAKVAVILLVLAGILFVSCAGARNETFAEEKDWCTGFRDAKGRCVKNNYDPPKTCPPGQEKDKSGTCVKICPPEMKNVGGACVCPPGYENVDGRCLKPCPRGMMRDVRGACVCPPGMVRDA